MQQEVMQQRLSKYCSFESLQNIFEGSLILEISFKKKQVNLKSLACS